MAVFEHRNIGYSNADLLRELGDAHFALGEHDIDVDNDCHTYTVRSFSDLISTAFWSIFSNTTAAVATTTEPNVINTPIIKAPAASSLPWVSPIHISSAITKLMTVSAQYLIVRNALMPVAEKTALF